MGIDNYEPVDKYTFSSTFYVPDQEVLVTPVVRKSQLNDMSLAHDVALRIKLFQMEKGIDNGKVVYAKPGFFQTNSDGEYDYDDIASKFERGGLTWVNKPAKKSADAEASTEASAGEEEPAKAEEGEETK